MKKQLLFTLTLFFSVFLSFGQTFEDTALRLRYTITSSTAPLTVSVQKLSFTQLPTGNLVIPATVNYLGNTYTVTSTPTDQGGAFGNCPGLTSVTVPSTLTSLGGRSFIGCANLSSVTLFASTQSIGFQSFWNCSALTSFTIHATTPPSVPTDVFTGSNISNCVLRVVSGTLPAYQANTVWASFGSFQSFTCSPPENSIAAGSTTFCSPGSVTLNIPTGPVTDLNFSTGYVGGMNTAMHWQSFVPTKSGFTTGLSIWINGAQNINTALKIYSGSGIAGTLISTQPVVLSAPNGFLTIPITSVELIAGQTYTFQLTGNSINLGIFSGSYGSYTNTNGPVPPFRLLFKTMVTVPTPANIQWYNNGVAINGANSTSYNATTSGNYNYTANNCPDVSNTIVVTATPPPSAPAANATQIYAGSATISNLTATGTNLQWYANLTGGTALPNTTALVDGTVYYVSQSDLCGESTRTSVTVKKISEASQSFCDGATITNLVSTPSAGQTVQWYSDAAGTMPVFGNTPLANGTYYVSQQIPSIVSTFAGSGTAGNVNATGIAAQFNRPRGVITDSQGNLFVTDYLNLAIRKIDPSGVVTTFATGFNLPHGISIDGLDNLYIGDSGNSRIRKITPLAVVTNVAGDGNQGDIDGPSNTAQFTNPAGVKFDSFGNIYVADVSNYKVRKISTTGDVTTLAGSTSGYNDAQGNLAQFGYPSDVTTDSFGNVFIADLANNVIRKITPTGAVSTFAGSTAGYADGIGTAAQFNSPRGIAIDASNNLYVMDTNNRRVRKISPTGVVTTIAGIGTSGTTDGNGNVAQFGISWGLTVDVNGIIYVADTNNNKIRKIIQATAPSNLVAVTVAITPNTDNVTAIAACGSYTWSDNDQTYTESGIYSGTTTNCVTEKLDLTITPLANNSVTQSGDNLTATETGATYQWVTCETNGSFTPINLATNPSYFVTNIGSYAVEVTKNGCMIRSACVNVTTLNNSGFDTTQFSYYPNPTSDILHISNNKEISEVIVYNLLGQTVFNQKYNSQEVTLDLSQLPTNAYLVKVICGEENNTFKIMKK